MKKSIFASALLAMMFVLGGCDEDQRNTEEKQAAEPLDYNSRVVMACPKCGAPQRPYRITTIKSYYKCTGIPPKFVWHEEKKWDHRFHDQKDNHDVIIHHEK
jgi:hypothetical protein